MPKYPHPFTIYFSLSSIKQSSFVISFTELCLCEKNCIMDHVYIRVMKSFYSYLANLPLLVLLLLSMMTTSKTTLATSFTSSLTTFFKVAGWRTTTLGSNFMLKSKPECGSYYYGHSIPCSSCHRTCLFLRIHVVEATRVAGMTAFCSNALDFLVGTICKIPRIVWTVGHCWIKA